MRLRQFCEKSITIFRKIAGLCFPLRSPRQTGLATGWHSSLPLRARCSARENKPQTYCTEKYG